LVLHGSTFTASAGHWADSSGLLEAYAFVTPARRRSNARVRPQKQGILRVSDNAIEMPSSALVLPVLQSVNSAEETVDPIA
jgi:hypothetical protein